MLALHALTCCCVQMASCRGCQMQAISHVCEFNSLLSSENKHGLPTCKCIASHGPQTHQANCSPLMGCMVHPSIFDLVAFDLLLEKMTFFFLQQPAALLKVQVYATQLKHKHNHMIFVQKIKKL
jgi:hypothetical protein